MCIRDRSWTVITITKKESSLVWMLRKAKTARLVITLYRHITDKLPTSYGHITNCRPTVGRLIVYVLGKTCWPSVGRQTANRRPTVGQQTADSRPTDGQQSANRRRTVGQQTANSWPTGFLGSSSSQLPTKYFYNLEKTNYEKKLIR